MITGKSTRIIITKPLYLHTNMDAGHAGAAGRFDRLKEKALIYAFLLEVMGFNSDKNN